MNERIIPMLNRRRGYDMARSGRRMRERNMHGRYMQDGLMYDNPNAYVPNRYSESENERLNYERGSYGGRSRSYDGCSGEYYQPIEFMGRFNGYYGAGNGEYDYARGRRRDYGCGDYHHSAQSRLNDGYLLSDEELRKISDELFRTIDEKEKQLLTKEHIRRQVDEIGIKFERFTFEELYMTMLMLFKDYNKILGTANMDIYPKLARAFLEDEDAAVRYGEKLAMYYDCIVMGDTM